MVGKHGILSWSCFEIPLSCMEQWFYQGKAGCKDRPAALLPEGTDSIWKQNLEKSMLEALSKQWQSWWQ